MSIRYRPLACSTKRRNGAASSSPRPRPVSLRTISNQSHSFVFLEESLGAHTRSVDAPASLGGGFYASASYDGEVGGGGSGSGGVGGVGSAGVGAGYEQSQILRYLNAAGDSSMGITVEQFDSLTNSLANGGSHHGGRGDGGGDAGDSDEGDGSDDLMSSAGALSVLGSDGDGGGSGGGGGGGGGESDEDRAPSPIIIWRSTARVKLAEDVPLELLRELEAEADQLNETGVGGGNWTTAHEQSGPATSGTPGSPGKGSVGNGGSVGGSGGGRRAGPPPFAFPHRKKRNTPGGLTPGRTLRVAHSPVRTSTTEYQGPPLPASSFTYKPYRPRAKPAYGNAWYLRPDEWNSHSASPRTHGNAGCGGAGGGGRQKMVS